MGYREYAERRLPIIARTPRVLAGAAAVIGLAAWAFYLERDLVLAHYDAKAHLVVARRIVDSLTPGWRQIGAVWLPLPHLLQAVPTQVDLLYRTGAAGSLLSIACLATTVWAFARLVIAITGSGAGAAVAALLLAVNPNLLYLHVTPMTEPLLVAACALAVLWTFEWLDGGGDPGPVPRRLGIALAAAAWTRYEAWAVIAALAAIVACGLARSHPFPLAARRGLGYLAWPLGAAALFLINSRVTIGAWLVSGGFYVPDPRYQGHLIEDAIGVWWGTHQLSGYVIETLALGTAGVLAWRGIRQRDRWPVLLPVALLAAAALPFYAMFEGHPYRIRYMVPIVAACALLCGMAVGLARRPVSAAALAGLILVSAIVESPPWDQQAPLLLEARWDEPASRQRRAVRDCLATGYGGEKVMASMGSLAHVMQELSHHGLVIADFIHEGNGAIWELALETGPAPHAGWMLAEEQSEGGDVLARRISGDPAFAAGMRRVCEGGGVGLYRRW